MANEKRLIDANALDIPSYGKLEHPDPFIDGFRQGKIDAILEVKTLAPTVDAVEVVHGRWIKGKYPGEYTCSRCGMQYCEADHTAKPYKYCPECGSKNE